MKFAGSLLLAAASLVSAQVTYNATDDSFYCPIANGSYCAGDSLTGSMIILCSNYYGQRGDCNGHIQDRPPINLYETQCYHSSPEAGDAVCAKNCTVWPEGGARPYDVPGSCNYSQASTGSDLAGWGLNTGNSTNSTSNSTSGLSTPTPTLSGSTSPTASVSSTGSGSGAATPSSTGNAGVPAHVLHTGSSIFGLALAVAIAL